MTKNRRDGSSIHLLNVQRPIAPGEATHSYTADMITGAREAAGMRVLRPVQDLFEAEGIPYTARIVLGEPAEAIVRHAAELGCTSIVMGTRGMSAIGTLLLASVATRVVNLTDIPLTLIKRPRETSVAALLRRAGSEKYRGRQQRRMAAVDLVQGT
jgi:nucleotide-binding universal stress UspA family protein